VPQSALDWGRVLEGLHPAPTLEELDELLFRGSKAEGHADGAQWLVEVTPDRLDLLSEGGLRQHLEGLLGQRLGLPPIPRHDPDAAPPVLRVDRSVAALRPAIAAVRLAAPPGASLDAATLAEAIRFQELLHATIGLDRRSASLGIYPWASVRPPLRYRSAPLAGRSFVPLGASAPVELGRFFDEHPLAQRYGALGRDGDRCLVLEDADGTILSLPPVLNGAGAGEARVGDRALLLEATGRRAARVEDALGLLELVFVARGWSVAPVAVDGEELSDTGDRFVRPREVGLDRATLQQVTGLALSDAEVDLELRRARLGPTPSEAGWTVAVPPWRPDLQSAVDLVEEVLLARGIRPEERRVPPSRTRGARLPEERWRRAFRERLLGLGFQPRFGTVLVSEELGALIDPSALALENPVSLELARLRPRLLIGLVGALARNVRYGYPQRISEVGPVVTAAPGAESGTVTRTHAGFVVADERAGFAEAAALVDRLLERLQLAGVREPAELPATIPGRRARLRIAGEPVAEIGELGPALLDRIGLVVPVAWAEIDLSAVLPLLRPE
jgi:phenylalanyl-tRNA synthetase beta chain